MEDLQLHRRNSKCISVDLLYNTERFKKPSMSILEIHGTSGNAVYYRQSKPA
jgi:hypothetical protein